MNGSNLVHIDAQSDEEKNALDLVLSNLEVAVGVFYKHGAEDIPIKNMSKFDIKDSLVTNQHGLQEIRLDMSDLTVSGSSSYTAKTLEIFTEYNFQINKNKFINETIESCIKHYECNINIPSELEMINSLYVGI